MSRFNVGDKIQLEPYNGENPVTVLKVDTTYYGKVYYTLQEPNGYKFDLCDYELQGEKV